MEIQMNGEMLTAVEIQRIGTKINERVHIPFVKEEKEQEYFEKAIRWIDSRFFNVLQTEYYVMYKSTLDGINETEALMIKKIITDDVNEAINIPAIPEIGEQIIFGEIISLLVDAMIKGFDIYQVTKPKNIN